MSNELRIACCLTKVIANLRKHYKRRLNTHKIYPDSDIIIRLNRFEKQWVANCNWSALKQVYSLIQEISGF